MIGELILGGWLFLAGLNQDGTTIGFAMRQNTLEYQVSYMSAPRKTYAFNNFLNFDAIPSLVALKPLIGEDALDYSYIALHVTTRWEYKLVLPIEFGVGVNGKIWYLNGRYNERPLDRYSFGPTFITSIYTSQERESGVRIMWDNNVLYSRSGLTINEINVILFINMDFDWSNKPPKEDDTE